MTNHPTKPLELTGQRILLLALPMGDPQTPPLPLATLHAHLNQAGYEVAAVDLNRLLYDEATPEERGLWSAGADAPRLDLTAPGSAGQLATLADAVANSEVRVVGLLLGSAPVALHMAQVL